MYAHFDSLYFVLRGLSINIQWYDVRLYAYIYRHDIYNLYLHS